MRKSTKRGYTPKSSKPCIEDFDLYEVDNEIELTPLKAVEQIGEVLRNSSLTEEAVSAVARPIAYLEEYLKLNHQQAMVFAIMMNMYYDKSICLTDISRFVDISPIAAMNFVPDLDHMCKLNYLRFREDDDARVYRVASELIDAIQYNTPLKPKSFVVKDDAEFFDELDDLFISRCKDNVPYENICSDVQNLLQENPRLLFVRKFTAISNGLSINDQMLFLWCCNMLVTDGYQQMAPDNFRRLYDSSATYRSQRNSLATGVNDLLKQGLLQVAKSAGPRVKDSYELTPMVVEDMLSELKVDYKSSENQGFIKSDSITPKQLFYNPTEGRAVDQLTSLLMPERYQQVRSQLRKRGFRSGFACLFHGAPGTGKTETVLQLARKTGRDLMQVNISEIKSMWVGESEKNIKAIFAQYRKLSEASKVAPILFFNEADAIIGKRLENVERSVDKMENSIQNIILEELEMLDGILIATTNLTCNMDKAFERRFLYKIEFAKPSLEAKSSIWLSMIPELKESDAELLARKYDFSGGQIENIARKNVVDMILTGEQMSVEVLERHCDAELLAKPTLRKAIGY